MDPASLIVEALDGRTQAWLAKRTHINRFHLNRVLKGHLPCTRDVYERCRPYLPTLPPWPVDERAETAA
jgi:hypothetical protein